MVNDENNEQECKIYTEWMGEHIDNIDLSVLGERDYRVIRPDSMVTMDYIPERLNIRLNEDGIISEQDCG